MSIKLASQQTTSLRRLNSSNLPIVLATPNSPTVDENSTVIWTITTFNIASGTTLYWTNVGTTTGSDFSTGSNSGSFTITNGSGTISILPIIDTTESDETIILQIRSGSITGRILTTLTSVVVKNIEMNVIGQASYTSPGTYSWTAPEGVISVSVVCIGGGAGQKTYGWSNAAGGGGGGLGWKNAIPVTPGQTYTVVVGGGGSSDTAGGDSYFINTSTVRGGGGGQDGTNYNTGGTYIGDGGGNGGTGGTVNTDFAAGGGGGAGGYTGAGGDGGLGNRYYAYTSGGAGTGGSAGGGGGSAYYGGGAGGGTGINGQGTNGTSGAGGGSGGGGGSAGTAGGGGGGDGSAGSGGAYGGGAGGKAYNSGGPTTGVGAGGAVKIIWGAGRAFPSTNTANM